MASEGRYQIVVQVPEPMEKEQITEAGVAGILCKVAGVSSVASKSNVHFMTSKA